MPNDSSTGGFLVSLSAIPNDAVLEDLISPTIMGITGLTQDLVRPRLQLNPPAEPDRAVSWVAFGIVNVKSDLCAAVVQNAVAQTASVIRYRELEFLFSWYGPNASNNAETLRDGLQVGQNRDLLVINNIGIIDIGDARKVPDLLKQQFRNRYDQTLLLRQRTERTYPILTLQEAGIALTTDPLGSTPTTINVTSATPQE